MPVKGVNSMWIMYPDEQNCPLGEASKMKWSDQTGTIYQVFLSLFKFCSK